MDAPPTPPKPARPRRTQEQRRRDMRHALIEATLDSLQQGGYHGASLGDILARAGVSRGAWAHYFDSKLALVAAAAEAMLQGSVTQAGAVAAELPASPDTPPEERLALLLDAVWRRFYQGRHRDVLFELAVACRTDAALRERLAPVFADLLAALGRAWGARFRPRAALDGSAPSMDELMRLTVYMLRGMAMQEAVSGRDDDAVTLRRRWAHILAGMVEVDP